VRSWKAVEESVVEVEHGVGYPLGVCERQVAVVWADEPAVAPVAWGWVYGFPWSRRLRYWING
jgi:hypothetical protein